MQDKTREQIREQLLGNEKMHASLALRAHEIYEQRGGAPGGELEDWLQAENEILLPLIEEELQRGTESQVASDEMKTEKPAIAEKKPAKKAARLFRRNRPASERSV